MREGHIVTVEYSDTGHYKTSPVFQYDYGQEIQFDNFDHLPDTFEVHFGTSLNNKAVSQICTDGVVRIPDECLKQRQPVFAWLFLHDTEDDGETVFVIEIPIIARAKVVSPAQTKEEQDVITQTIAALNAAIERVESGDLIPVADVTEIIDNYEGS